MINSHKDSAALTFFSLPAQNAQLDIITPHKLAVVFLIQEYLVFKRNEIILPKHRRQFCLLLLKLIQYPDMSYKDLYQHLTSPILGITEQHLEGFEKLMRHLSQIGIEVLFDVQHLMNKVMSESASTNGGVSHYGIVGLYLRRIHVTLEKMSFPELISLYKCTLAYYEKGIRALVMAPDISLDIQNEETENELICKDRPGSCSKWSIRQSELFVVKQCTLLTNSENDALDPTALDFKLKEIIKDNPNYPQAHFVNYLNNMRIREFQNAEDSLHRAFDRNMLKQMMAHDSKGFQYSSLNLAIFHANFGHKDEALSSLRECIMLAQECGDRVCLQIAQTWLYYLDKSQINLNETLVSNKTELSLIHSISLGIQYITKRAALTGHKPSRIFDLLLKSDVLNCQHSIMNLICNCIAEKAAIWTMYGKNEIASLNGQILLNANLKTLGKSNNGEGNCQALCCLATWLCLQGDYVLGSVVIDHARNRFPRQPISNYWMTSRYYTNSIHAIYQQKWNEGMEAITLLYTYNEQLGILQTAALNIARGSAWFAKDILNEFLERDDLDNLSRVRAMILLSYALITPQGVSPHVSKTINHALDIAKQKYFDYEYSTLQMIHAYVLLDLKMPGHALKLVNECCENIMSNGGIYDKAKCIFLQVKCIISLVANKSEKMSQCLKMLEKSVEYFMKIECYPKVKDIYIYIATFYHELNLIDERNLYAYKMRKIEEQYPTSSEYLNIFF